MILASGIPNSSLSLASSIRFSMFGISSPKALIRASPRAARIGDAAKFAGLERGTGGEKRAAEGPFSAGLSVAVVGHVLYARGAHVVLNILVEDRPGPRAKMRHHVFAEETAGIGEPLGMLVSRRVEHETRVLSRPRRQHHGARFLQPALLFLIVVLDAGHPRALLIREHPRDGRARPHFGAGLS